LRIKPVGRYGAVSVRSWPWLLWFLWKNRNSFIFEGKTFEAEEIVVKANQEAEVWFLAQQVQSGMELEEEFCNGSVFVTECSGWLGSV